MGHKVNFLQEPIFSHRFKRPAKVWTIDEVHDLWERAYKRSAIRLNTRSECLNRIVNEIPKNDKGEHITYYTINDSEDIHKFRMTYHNEWKSYGVGRDRLEFSKDVVVRRNEKIEFLINSENNRAFELGQEYYELGKMESNLHHIVLSILWDMVENKLRAHFDKINKIPEKVFIIDIGTKKYYVGVDDEHRYGYRKFKLKGEYSPNDVIKID